MNKILLTLLFLLSILKSFSQGQFKVRNDQFIQIGYTSYKALTFGQSTSTPNFGSFSIEYWGGGLNFWKPWPTAGHSNYLLFIGDNGNVGVGNAGNTTEKLWISGNLRVNSTVYTSDERFKKNITSIQKGLGDVLSLKPYQYSFNQALNEKSASDSLSVNVLKEKKVNYNFDDRLHFGFSAQEIKGIFPHLVSEDNNGFLAVNYVELIPLLVKALQEQNEKIVELERVVSSIVKK